MLVKRNLINYWVGFLLFSSIYAYKLPLVGNSANWSFAVIILSLLLVDNSYSNFKLLLKYRFIYTPFAVLTSVLLISFIIPIIYLTFDFTMIKTWVNNLLSYIAMVILACIYCSNNKTYKSVFLIVFIIFIIQAVIMWLMLAIPSLRDFIQELTKNAATIDRMGQYGGVRGLGFTSFGAFGLAVIMGLLGLFLNYYFAVYKQHSSLVFKIFIFFIAFIASISAGRTAAGGFLLGVVFFYFSLGGFRFFKGLCKVAIYCLVLSIPIISYVLSQPELVDVAVKYYQYAFRFLHLYFTDGAIGRTSLATLDNMYFFLSEQQVLFGDGKYTGSDGNYYMNTDPGFMRFTLFFGVFPSLFLYFSFIYIMFSYYLLNRNYVKHLEVLIISVISLSFIYHYKGEIIMFGVSYMKIIYFVFISISIITLKAKFLESK
jgi:hypothetical protein